MITGLGEGEEKQTNLCAKTRRKYFKNLTASIDFQIMCTEGTYFYIWQWKKVAVARFDIT